MPAASVDKMNGIGMPILFIITLFATLFATRHLVAKAVRYAYSDTVTMLCFSAALTNMALSIFLYFTTAFNYGLVTTVLAYCVAFMNSNENFKQHMPHLLAVHLVWFLVLVGIPSSLNHGIINATNTGDCVAFYATFASTMCVEGWLTFIKIVACIITCFTLFSVLLLASEVLAMLQTGRRRTEISANQVQAQA
ncbi:hypothetical protein DQ04_05661050 [Trypanosoma grayi]|uniref:hypothetical protein n=1 Tax=Trypanosoma grayi TaxID=71804 RepID=UPI0004F414C7|nr:hypothetical protein DQ04_05661050 [Trypanosoma grayi]KEG09183.1 hypothetical protein DQ04_05661050 [Trypanosoma grayi]